MAAPAPVSTNFHTSNYAEFRHQVGTLVGRNVRIQLWDISDRSKSYYSFNNSANDKNENYLFGNFHNEFFAAPLTSPQALKDFITLGASLQALEAQGVNQVPEEQVVQEIKALPVHTRIHQIFLRVQNNQQKHAASPNAQSPKNEGEQASCMAPSQALEPTTASTVNPGFSLDLISHMNEEELSLLQKIFLLPNDSSLINGVLEFFRQSVAESNTQQLTEFQERLKLLDEQHQFNPTSQLLSTFSAKISYAESAKSNKVLHFSYSNMPASQLAESDWYSASGMLSSMPILEPFCEGASAASSSSSSSAAKTKGVLYDPSKLTASERASAIRELKELIPSLQFLANDLEEGDPQKLFVVGNLAEAERKLALFEKVGS